MRTHTKDDLRVAEEAADWLLRLEQDCSTESHAEFVAWTKQSARNLHEFLFVKAASEELSGIDPQKTIDLSSLGIDPAVVELHHKARSTPPLLASRQNKRRWVYGLSAAVLSALALSATLWQSAANDADFYQTAVGEQRSFKLSDGSVVHLNTDSRIEVRFSATGRELNLIDGEAFFIVAREATRAFRVEAGAARVQAIGTQFNVYRHNEVTTVSVIEGRVSIAGAPGNETKEAAAGEQAQISHDRHIEKRAVADIERATAWRGRRLVFQADRLEEVAAQFNRYSTRPIRVEGLPALNRELSGVFDADDPQPLLRFLANDPALTIEDTTTAIVIRSR